MKNSIMAAKDDSEQVVATMDLQSVLQIPQSKESQFYYKRKLCLYNSTFYVETSGEAYCFVWTELDSKRGANEIGTCVKKYVETQVQNGKTKIVLWSDNCGGQNRNKFLMSMYHKLVQDTPDLDSIQHSYLETGHTQVCTYLYIYVNFLVQNFDFKQMSVDSMHSLIERAAKHATIFAPNEWCNIMRAARSKRPYNVVRLSYKDFIDLKSLHKTDFNAMDKSINGERINWMKIRSFKFEKSKPEIMQFTYTHDSEDFQVIGILIL